MYEKYPHHQKEVWVRSDLKGSHRDHCLCFSCKDFHPDEPNNCNIAQAIFRNCIAYSVTTPVFECPEFNKK